MTDRGSPSTPRRERAVLVIVSVVLLLVGGLAAIATGWSAVDHPSHDDYNYDDRGVIAWYYAGGTACAVLTFLWLFWALPRWWEGRLGPTGRVCATLCGISVLATGFLWITAIGVLVSS